MLLQNVGTRSQDYTVPKPRTLAFQHKTKFPSKLRKWGETKSFATVLSVVSFRDDT
jgi:hypothetical protein